MPRVLRVLVLVFCVAQLGTSQSVPAELLSNPARLELDKSTVEVKAGSIVNYTVVLKNAKGQAVAASSNLQLEVETPSGKKTVEIPAGQSSANFTWTAANSGVAHMTVRSGKLYPATGLVLVTPPMPKAAIVSPNLSMPSPEAQRVPPSGLPMNKNATGAMVDRTPAGAQAQLPSGAKASQRSRGINQIPVGAMIDRAPAGAQSASASSAPAPQPSATAAPPPPPPASGQAKKIQLYVEPLPVYGNPLEHIWNAKVSVAVLGDQDSLAPVATDVPIEFHSSSGRLSPPSIILHAGQFSNFDNPVLLTTDRAGADSVDALSSLGHAGPVEVTYLLPPPAQLRLSLGTPAINGSGTSTVNAQVCLLDESGALTFSGQDVQVTLTAPGQLASSVATIRHGVSCSDLIAWTSASGAASIQAEAGGLKSDNKAITFPSFPWYFVWLAAGGGLLGALVSSSKELFSSRWFSNTWRGLALGAVLGAIFYLFARFGAIALPKDSPVNIQNIPVVSRVGAFLLGFLGGLYGRKLWKIDQDKPDASAPPKPPLAIKAAGGNGGGGD